LWLFGEDPPPQPPEAVLSVPSWEHAFPVLGDRIARVPDVDLGLPQSERDFLTRRRWAHMPPFEIVEEPLAPWMLSYPRVQQAQCVAGPPAPAAVKPRYEALPPAAVDAVPRYRKPEPMPAPESIRSEAAPEYSALNLPTPSADPVAMVVELFEKLKASESRGAAARAQLAQAQQDLAALRATKAEPASGEPGEMVVLEIRFLELDLDGIAKAQIDVPGVCAEELGESGLFALAARGALDCCRATAIAQGPAAQACDCVTCSNVSTEAQGPPARQLDAIDGVSRDAAADTDRVKALLAELVEAGLVETLSRPQAMAKSGQTARICIGQEIPFKQTVANEKGVPVESVSYCRAGIEFDVKPQVLADGQVQIQLRAERSDVDQGGLWRNGAPTISRHSIETSLEIPAGKTAVAAGLIFERPVAVKSRYSTPGGAQVQLPHAAVQYTPYRPGETTAPPSPTSRPDMAGGGDDRVKTHQRRELVVLVTPKVVAPAARAADEVTEQ
jgi:hypothetical protein